MNDNKFKTLANDIVFKSIFFKNEELLKWLMNRTFKSLNLNYSINNFNVRNGELVVDKVFLKSRALDVLIDNVKTPKDNEYNGKYKELEINSYKEYPKIKEIINIDIAKYIDKWYNLNKDKEYYEKYKHFLLIGMSKEDLISLEDDDKMVKKIKNEIFNLNDPSEFPRLFSDEEFLEIEKNTSFDNGLEKGIEQGTINTNINNARKMKKKNISNKVIQEITGLSMKTISML